MLGRPNNEWPPCGRSGPWAARSKEDITMGGIASVLYGVLAYLLFLGTFLYAIAFVGNLPVPKTIDSGEAGPVGPALIIDTLLLGLFAIQHSVMARPAFKRWWTRFVPQPVERTTYVLLASLALAAPLLAVAADTRAGLVGDQSGRRRWSCRPSSGSAGPSCSSAPSSSIISSCSACARSMPGCAARRCRRRCSRRRSSTSRCGIRSISGFCSPSGRRRP